MRTALGNVARRACLLFSFSACGLIAAGRADARPADAKEIKVSDPAAATDGENAWLWTAGKWTGLVAGGLGLAAGSALYLVGSSDEATIADARRDDQGRVRGVTQSQAATLQDSASAKMTAGVVVIGIGAALAAGGAVLWALEPRPPESPVVPEPVPRDRPYGAIPGLGFVVEFGNGLQIRGSF